ncbi:MAG: elongation factor 1-beta [Desulfurococcaceae archaeon]
MAHVAVIVRIFPEDIEIKHDELLNRIEKSLPQGYSIKAWEEEPIAFGLKALKILFLMPEETEGGTEQLETTLSQIPGVSQVEVLMVQRISW